MQAGIFSIFATAFCGIFSLLLAIRYLNFHPYFFDAVSYSFYNIRLLELVRLDGNWPVAWQEILGNNRHPLRTVPLILFWPSLLGQPFGHVPFALLALFVFLSLLGWLTLQTTGNRAISGLVVLTAACMPGIFQPWTGISAYWLDLVAALLMGGALLSLACFGNSGGNGWLILCGILGASACLSRYVAAVYLAFAGIPCALILLFSRARHDPKPLVFFCRSLICLVIPGGLLAGPFLAAHAESVADFYRTYGYALGAPVGAAIRSLKTSAGDFLSPLGVAILLSAAVFKGWHCFRQRKADGLAWMAALWMALAVPLFLVFVAKAATGHTVAYAVVCWWVALVMPWGSVGGSMAVIKPRYLLFSTAFILMGWAWQYVKEWRAAGVPSDEAAGIRAMQTRLADELTRAGRPVVWNAYFGELSWIPAVDAYYRHRILPIPLGQDYVFSVHESVYRGNFPGWPLKRIQEFLYNNAVQHLEIAVVLEDFTHAERTLPGPTGRAVAEFMSRQIREDPRWEKVFEIENPWIGRLGGYRNEAAPSDSYTRRLRGNLRLAPSES